MMMWRGYEFTGLGRGVRERADVGVCHLIVCQVSLFMLFFFH